MSWAFGLEIRPSALKFLLVAVADNAGADGELFPSIDALTHKTSLDRKTVIRGLDELERIGFLVDTQRRVGRTRQIKVYRLNGFDTGERHYTYCVTDKSTGEFYVGVRTCIGAPEADIAYLGSGTWPLQALRDRRQLIKTVLAEHASRREAENAETSLISQHGHDPLCRNLKGSENGTNTKNGTVPLIPENSTVFSDKSPVFPSKGSQKRHTEPSGNHQEPSGNLGEARKRASAARLSEDFSLTPKRREVAEAERVDADREFAKFRDHWAAASGANARKNDWDAAWRNWCRKAADFRPRAPPGSEPQRTWRPPPDEETENAEF